MKTNSIRYIHSAVTSGTKSLAPIIELTDSQRENIRTVVGATLAICAVSGVVLISAVAPNLLQVIGKLCISKKNKSLSYKESQKKVSDSFYYLKRKGLIQITPTNKGLIARLTSLGKKRVEHLGFDTLYIPKPKVWDKKWWLIAGDIPTKDFKKAADMFRWKAKQLQLFPLQRTLWLYPYNPIKEIEFLANYYGIGRFITVMEINRLDKDDENKVKKFYGL